MIRKMMLAVVVTVFCHSLNAQENYLQIKPKAIALDAKTKAIELDMVNEETFLCLGFKIFLPEGVSFASRVHGTLNKARFPYTEEYDEYEDQTYTTFNHSVQYQAQSDGSMKFAISANDLSVIKGNSGRIVPLCLQFDAGLQSGIYPVKITNVEFTQYTGGKMVTVYGTDVTSFIEVGDALMDGKVDLSFLTGFVPADVCTGTTAWLYGKTDVTEVNLTGIDNGGAAISAANPNALYYVREGSAFAAVQSSAMNNVVVGGACANLSLTDGYTFHTSEGFTAAKASYARTVSAPGWYSLCLPFAASAPSGVNVERYGSFNVASNSIKFVTGSVEAYTPCIFKTENTDVLFEATDVAISATDRAEMTDGDMVGTLKRKEAGSLTGLYALQLDGSGFGRCTETATASPFRAFVSLPSQVRYLTLLHDDDSTTGIRDVEGDGGLKISSCNDRCVIESVGKARQVVITALDGRVIRSLWLGANESRVVLLPNSVYIVNNQKIVVE